MVVLKRTFLILLILITLIFFTYQVYLVIEPVNRLRTEIRYVQLVDQYQVLKMQRLVLEEKNALETAKTKAVHIAFQAKKSPLTLNRAYFQNRKNLLAPHLAWQINNSPTHNIALSLNEAKTFEQLEAYVSDNKKQTTSPLSSDEKSLLELAATDFTLQLMGVRDMAELTRFVKDNDLADARIFHTYYLDKDWYVLVLGNYKNHTEALKAIEDLPASLQELKPWIRQLASIQNAIQLYR